MTTCKQQYTKCTTRNLHHHITPRTMSYTVPEQKGTYNTLPDGTLRHPASPFVTRCFFDRRQHVEPRLIPPPLHNTSTTVGHTTEHLNDRRPHRRTPQRPMATPQNTSTTDGHTKHFNHVNRRPYHRTPQRPNATPRNTSTTDGHTTEHLNDRRPHDVTP